MVEKAEQIHGLDLDPPLPAGCVPLEAYVLVKVLNDDGMVSVHSASTEGLSWYEAAGMLDCEHDFVKKRIMEEWRLDESD
jgi:hypothetical protein